MKKLLTFIALSGFMFNAQAQEMPARIPHLMNAIGYLDGIRGELVKELQGTKDEAAMLVAAKHILAIDKTIITLHALEHLHDQTAKAGK